MVRNKEQANSICELWLSILEQIFHLPELFYNGNFEACLRYMEEINRAFERIYEIAEENQEEEIYRYLMDYVIDASVSLDRIKGFLENKNLEKAESKLEFELIPILRVAYAKFYYHALIYPDKDLIREFEESGEMHELLKNYYVEESLQTGEWKFDLSVIIVAYNELDYTKQCVESFLHNKPEGIRYELILYNHGSTDGTKEYFESIHPDKQIDLAKNSNLSISNIVCEGRYKVVISNDVVVTPNALNIMYEAMLNNKKVAWAVPSTSNVANLQEPYENPLKYQSIEELYEECKGRNVRNECLEERRIRLCNPISIYNPLVMEGVETGVDINAYVALNASHLAFPDDLLSLFIRRQGYHSILLKDVYCHHFGSVTIGKEKDMEKRYNDGRKRFRESFGVDPWDESYCFDICLFNDFIFDKEGEVKVLGMNPGFGSNLLKIREVLKEKGNENVLIDIVNSEPEFDSDLKYLADNLISVENPEQGLSEIRDKYNYILFDRRSFFKKTDEQKIHMVETARERLNKEGVIIIHKDIDINIERLNPRIVLFSNSYYIVLEWDETGELE